MDLLDAIKQLVADERKYDAIVVEATGVASPMEVRQQGVRAVSCGCGADE